jgi:hypothetical protein
MAASNALVTPEAGDKHLDCMPKSQLAIGQLVVCHEGQLPKIKPFDATPQPLLQKDRCVTMTSQMSQEEGAGKAEWTSGGC